MTADLITPDIREAAGLAVCKLKTTTACSKVCRECAPVIDAALAAAAPMIVRALRCRYPGDRRRAGSSAV